MQPAPFERARLHVPSAGTEIFIYQDAEELFVIDAGLGPGRDRVVAVIDTDQRLSGLPAGLVQRQQADLADRAAALKLALSPLDDKGAGPALTNTQIKAWRFAVRVQRVAALHRQIADGIVSQFHLETPSGKRLGSKFMLPMPPNVIND